MDNPLSAMFSTVGIVYGLVFPILIAAVMSFIFTASLHNAGAKPRAVAQAIFCYFMMSVGILLMVIAALPTAASVMAGMSYSIPTYVALLVTFASGGCLYLWHDDWAHNLDHASRAVPHLIYVFSLKIIGSLITIVSALSILLTILLGGGNGPQWWVMPLSIFFLGGILTWATRSEKPPSPFFQSIPMSGGSFAMKRAAPAKKAAPTKVAKKKKARKSTKKKKR